MKKLEEPKYIVITNAKRQSLWTDSFSYEVHLETKDYRRGDLGLLHPDILSFYSNLEENMKKIKDTIGPFAGLGFSSSVPQCRPVSGLLMDFYKRKEGDIPVLIFDGGTYLGGPMMDGVGYFMAIFKQGEFEEIDAETLSSAKKSIIAAYKRNGIELSCSSNFMSKEQTLERAVEMQWRHLKAFDILFEGRIHEIPIEVSHLEIDPKIVNSYKDSAERMKKAEKESRGRRVYPDPIIYSH